VNWDDVIVDAASTDTGMRRTNNQDAVAVVRASSPELFKTRGHLFMVADGMGAHAVGEMASKLACDYIPHTYFKTKGGTPAEALTKAYQDVGAQIYNKAAANPDFHRMGTTCSTLVVLPAGALIAHVGDSRVYRIRGGRIDQLSFDHSLVWELVRKGHMKPEQAQKAYPRNVITRSLGPEPTVEVDIEGPLDIDAGDVFLICSDGLSGPVHDPEIGAIAAAFHPEEASRYLIHLANLRGGADNISVVIARVGPWVEPGEEAANDGDGAASRAQKGKGSFLSGLLGSLKNRNHQEISEENRYQSAKCPLDQSLVTTLTDVVKNAQAMAVEQAWSLDWPGLTQTRREAEEAFRSARIREAVRLLGEAITQLGQAGRLHRKESLNQGWA
jgi:protein phosphatase